MRVQPQREKESGDNGIGDPPVPIPNTEVKPYSADDTKRATAWESRTLPDRGKLASTLCLLVSTIKEREMAA